MKNLICIPYDTLTMIHSTNTLSSPQMNCILILHQLCDSNGYFRRAEYENINHIVQIMISKMPLLTRTTCYRAISKFIEMGLLQIDDNGDLYLVNYTDAYLEGSNGMVVMPIFVYTGHFFKLDKLTKKIALYLIGQIRNIEKIKDFQVSIKKLINYFGTYYSRIIDSIELLTHYFRLSFFHNKTVANIALRKCFLLDSYILEQLKSNFKRVETAKTKKLAELRSLIKSKNVEAYLNYRTNLLLRDKTNLEKLSFEELDVYKGLETITDKLKFYTYKDCSTVLNALCSKLKDFSRPIENLQAYLTTLISFNIMPKKLYTQK